MDVDTDSCYDLIVSNPPYIDTTDSRLQGTIRFEPQNALIAEQEGMCDLKKIIQQSHHFLKKGGWLILEHGFDQAETVLRILEASDYSQIKNSFDLNRKPRVTSAVKKRIIKLSD